jgi:hypothetical protein
MDAIMDRYNYVKTIDDYAILDIKKNYNPSKYDLNKNLIGEYKLKLGEKFLFPETDSLRKIWITIDIKPTLTGKIRSLLYQPSFPIMHLITSDKQEFTFRIIPSVAKSGFIISPLILSTDDLAALFSGIQSTMNISSIYFSDNLFTNTKLWSDIKVSLFTTTK